MRFFKKIFILFLVFGGFQLPAHAQSLDGVEAAPPVCLVASEGIFRGAWVKHRIYREDQVIYGANDLGAILRELENLRSEGLCQ